MKCTGEFSLMFRYPRAIKMPYTQWAYSIATCTIYVYVLSLTRFHIKSTDTHTRTHTLHLIHIFNGIEVKDVNGYGTVRFCFHSHMHACVCECVLFYANVVCVLFGVRYEDGGNEHWTVESKVRDKLCSCRRTQSTIKYDMWYRSYCHCWWWWCWCAFRVKTYRFSEMQSCARNHQKSK